MGISEYNYCGSGKIGKDIDLYILGCKDSPYQQQEREKYDQQPVIQGILYDSVQHDTGF